MRLLVCGEFVQLVRRRIQQIPQHCHLRFNSGPQRRVHIWHKERRVVGWKLTPGSFRATGLSVINALVGVWLFIAAFTIDASGAAQANDIILGVIVFVLALGSAMASERQAV